MMLANADIRDRMRRCVLMLANIKMIVCLFEYLLAVHTSVFLLFMHNAPHIESKHDLCPCKRIHIA